MNSRGEMLENQNKRDVDRVVLIRGTRNVPRTKSKPQPLRLLTKGDNNAADDTELYARGQTSLVRADDVMGSVVGFVPWVGYGTILLSEYPWLKTAMLGLMGLTVILQRE